jgi:hypothetical protein
MRHPLLAPTLALGALLLAAPVSAGRQKPVPDAVPAGKPVSCVSITQIRETRVRSDKVIDFYMAGGKIYRNELPLSCPQLGFEQRFLYRTSINQLCSVDTITVLVGSAAQPGVSCGLGQFQPVTIAKPAR